MNDVDFGGAGYPEAGGDDDNWLISYADLLTNLLAFFVLLFAISTVQTYRFEVMSSTFNKDQTRSFATLKEEVDRLSASQQVDVETVVDHTGLAIRFRERLLFDSARAEISSQGDALLGKLAGLLVTLETQYSVVVEGHADDRPIQTSAYASNWELSAARGVNVARRLIDKGVPRERVSAQAFADTRPPGEVSADPKRARPAMRRVVVRVR